MTNVSDEILRTLIKQGKTNAQIRRELKRKIALERMNRIRKHQKRNSPEAIRELTRLGERN